MPAGLRDFLAHLERAEAGPGEAAELFIFDQRLSPDIMGSLRTDSPELPYTLLPLLAGTERLDRALQGPLWCRFRPHSGKTRLALYHASREASGLVIEADDPLAAQIHARDLLYQRESTGLWFSAYYNPFAWAALALTANSGLFGPWRTVYSPAPKHIGSPRGPWLRWAAPQPGQPLTPPYVRHPETTAVQRTLRWVYWLDQHFADFGEPTAQQLPALIANLEFLVDHDIIEARWLLSLATLCTGRPLAERQDVLAILDEPDAAYNHYQRLLLL